MVRAKEKGTVVTRSEQLITTFFFVFVAMLFLKRSVEPKSIFGMYKN